MFLYIESNTKYLHSWIKHLVKQWLIPSANKPVFSYTELYMKHKLKHSYN